MPKLQTCLSDIEWDPKYGASRIPFRLFCQHWVLAVGRTRDRLKFFFRKNSWYIMFRPKLAFCSLLVAVISHQNQHVIVHVNSVRTFNCIPQ